MIRGEIKLQFFAVQSKGDRLIGGGAVEVID